MTAEEKVQEHAQHAHGSFEGFRQKTDNRARLRLRGRWINGPGHG